jgi:hypothetical protein
LKKLERNKHASFFAAESATKEKKMFVNLVTSSADHPGFGHSPFRHSFILNDQK